jgi:hypothetical protein
MAIPQVTFPLEQAQIKDVHDMLYKHLRGLQADVHLTQELLKTIRNFCSHPNKTKWSCPDCGADWGD